VDYKPIGRRIREARKKRGLTQKELGVAISRTESSIAKYEQGLVEIPNSVLSFLAAALGVSVNYLLGADERPPIGFPEPDQLPADVQRVAESMDQMNTEGREKVVDYADDLAQSGKYIKTNQSGMGQKRQA